MRAFLIGALLAMTTMTQAQTATNPVPTLTVEGTATLQRPADELRLTLGVVTEAEEAARALRDNSDAMDGVMRALQKAGLGQGEIETGRFQISPQYTPRPRNAEPDWRPRIIGYRVQNTINVKTPRLDQAGALIDTAVEAGCNSIDSISFGISDPRKHRQEAIREATQHALKDASTLADAAQLRLIRVLQIDLDHAQPHPVVRQYGLEMADAAMGRGAAATSITPGDVTINATVRIVYQIAEIE